MLRVSFVSFARGDRVVNKVRRVWHPTAGLVRRRAVAPHCPPQCKASALEPTSAPANSQKTRRTRCATDKKRRSSSSNSNNINNNSSRGSSRSSSRSNSRRHSGRRRRIRQRSSHRGRRPVVVPARAAGGLPRGRAHVLLRFHGLPPRPPRRRGDQQPVLVCVVLVPFLFF
jgi:hypothetical protein